jgi:hypothetical protein
VTGVRLREKREKGEKGSPRGTFRAFRALLGHVNGTRIDLCTMTMNVLTSDGRGELVVVGDVVYLFPAITPDMPPRLRRLLHLRREASITGICPSCSATANGGAPLAPRRGELVMEHEAWCPVADRFVEPLLLRYWRRRS